MRLSNIATSLALLSSFYVSSSTEGQMEVIEVFGNFEPIKASQLPSPTFVLNKRQIQSVSGETALEVLSHIPGVTAKKSGAVQEIFLRGAETNFVIIQIDGVQVNNPLDTRGGGFDLGSLTKNSLQRVEVIKGAQSLAYGSDAVAGVINFITFDNHFEGGEVSVGLLANGQKNAGMRVGRNGALLTVNLLSTDVQDNGDEQDALELSFSQLAQWDSGDIRTNLRYSDYQQQAYADQSGGVLYASDSNKDKKEGELVSASVRYNQEITESYQLAAQLEYFETHDVLRSDGIAPYTNAPATQSDNRYSYYKLRWLNGFNFQDLALTVGVDYKSETGDTSGFISLFGSDIPTQYQSERDNLAGFVDGKWSIGKGTVYSGFRHDSTKDYGNHNTWKIGVDYKMSGDLRFYANLGSAFKLPSLYALTNNLIGNADLKPEEAINADLGVEWQLERTLINVSAFAYEYKHLIDFDAETFALVNRSNITSRGIEIVLESQLSEHLSLQADVTYLNLDSSTGELLSGRPEWQGGLFISYQLSDTLTANLKANYVGESSATSLHTGEFTVSELAAYNKIDLSLAWSINQKQGLRVFLHNALNEGYQLAVGVPGNGIGAGFKYSHTF